MSAQPQPQIQTQSTERKRGKISRTHGRTRGGGAAATPLPAAASRFGAGATDEAAEASCPRGGGAGARPRGGGAEARCGVVGVDGRRGASASQIQGSPAVGVADDARLWLAELGRRGSTVARRRGGAGRLGWSMAWLPAAEKRAERRSGWGDGGAGCGGPGSGTGDQEIGCSEAEIGHHGRLTRVRSRAIKSRVNRMQNSRVPYRISLKKMNCSELWTQQWFSEFFFFESVMMLVFSANLLVIYTYSIM
ncbi:unnamed protein product [Miscanthus lutarioriparius]|uniref:Uncharacterized protein n=1 Tax=Miscanthus lutarioriparius TaxID=422564 RepID=A0A811MGV2_9POAL|nr:unnamed protein product [Miscanthus lutarioriparius]